MVSAIYCRVSTDEQMREGFSIRAQEQKLKEYANVKDWSIFNIYLDEGISAKNITNRPAINKMLDDIKAGHVKNVLVFKLDRLTRSVADLVFLIDVFNNNECAFNSLMESLDTSTASGRMFIKIIGIFAEFERENIAERVRVGKERKAREGYTNSGSQISYGYDREKGELLQTVNEAEAENVRMIFDMFINRGMSLSAIAKSFNMQKIPSKQGSTWNAGTIKGVLTNCTHIGNVRYSLRDPNRNFETEGKHEAIIAEELYNAAQILIQKNTKTAPTKKPDENNYFVNFLFCDKCGAKYKPLNTVYSTKKNNKQVIYSFQCYNRLSKSGCNTKSIAAKKVEMALVEYFLQIDDVFISDSRNLFSEQEKQKIEMQIQIYRDKIRIFDNKEREITSHFINDNVDFDSFKKIMKQLDSNRNFARLELEKLENNDNINHPVIVYRKEIAASFLESWQGLSNDEKRLFLTNFIKKIIISNEPVEGSRFGNAKITKIEFTSF